MKRKLNCHTGQLSSVFLYIYIDSLVMWYIENIFIELCTCTYTLLLYIKTKIFTYSCITMQCLYVPLSIYTILKKMPYKLFVKGIMNSVPYTAIFFQLFIKQYIDRYLYNKIEKGYGERVILIF